MKNRHHLWWPQRAYVTTTEKKFRSLPCLVIELDERVHALLHATTNPPKKPSLEAMHDMIQRHKHGACACRHE